MTDKNILFGKNCTPITPEKCHPHFPGNSPLKIEILSSPPPPFRKFVRRLKPRKQKGGGGGGAHYKITGL